MVLLIQTLFYLKGVIFYFLTLEGIGCLRKPEQAPKTENTNRQPKQTTQTDILNRHILMGLVYTKYKHSLMGH